MLNAKEKYLKIILSIFILSFFSFINCVDAAREYNATGVYFQGGSGDGWDCVSGAFSMFQGGAGDGYSSSNSSDAYVGFSLADTLVFSTHPTDSVRYAALATSPIVEVRDEYGNIIANATDEITVAILNDASAGGNAVLGGTAAKNASSGIATFNDLTIDQYGNGYTLSASATGLTAATSNSFNISYGTPAKLNFSTSPSSDSYAGVAITTQPVVQVLDASDNLVENAINTVILSIDTDPPGSSTLSGTASMAAVNGVADFVGKGLKINRAGTGYVLLASSGVLTTDTSSTFDVLSPIQVTSPNDSEVWTVSTAYDITWTNNGPLAIGTNTVQYSVNNGDSWSTITTSGTSPQSWVTPATATTQALVKVTNSADSTFTDTSDAVFKLAGGFNVLTPDGGEVWSNGYAHTLYWSTTGTVNNVKLEYYNGSSWTSITNSTANVNQYSWTPDVGSGGTGYKIRVTDATDADVTDSSASTFTLQKVAQTAPTSGQRILAGTSTNITWSSGGISNVKIEYSINDGSWTEIIASTSAAAGSYTWNIPSSFTTSTNVKVRISSTTTDDDGNTALDTSDAFTIYGQVTLTSPNGSEQWAANEAHDITWTTGIGTIENVKLEYSADNFVADVNTIIASTTNTGSYSWTPSTTGTTFKIRVCDAQDSIEVRDTSNNYFSVTGFGITSPSVGVTWDCGSSHTISWNSTGSFSNVKIEYYNGVSWSTVIASTPNTGSYSWTVSTSPSSSAKVRVSDAAGGGTTGTSSTFNVKAVLVLTSPNGSESYAVVSTQTISWTNTGTINNVKLEYYNGASWVTITNSTANTTPASGGSYSWAVPDAITASALVRVSDADSGHPASNDSSDAAFTITGGFTITAPTSANSWAVGEAHTITWTTNGTINNIRIYYATEDDSYVSWTEITSSATTNSGTYSWTVSDILTAVSQNAQTDPNISIKIKVVDAISGHPSTETISDVFTVLYYTITFSIVDQISGSNLSGLSVSCSSGWTAESLTSGVNAVRKYSYAAYTAVWTKSDYVDASVDFTADSSKTVIVTMESLAAAAQEYHVYSTFTYDSNNNLFIINSWMERLGVIVDDPTSCTITVYDNDGNLVDVSPTYGDGNYTLTSSSPNVNGVFRQSWDVANNPYLDQDSTYLGKVEIVYNGNTYSSNIVYTISVPQVTQLGTIAGNVSDIEASVGTGLSTKVDDLGTDIGNLQSDVTNLSEAVGADQSTTLYSKVSDVLEDTTTTIPQTIASEAKKGVQAQILNREQTVNTGSTVTVRYRTDSGLTPTITVYDADNNARVAGASMAEIATTGVYEYDVTFNSAWGTGDYTIICSEATLSSTDSMVISVGTGMLASVQTNIDSLSTNIDTVSSNVSTVQSILGTTSDTSDDLTLYGQLSGVGTDVTTVVGKWGEVTAAQLSGYVDSVEGYLGSPSDASGKRTIFGKIDQARKEVEDVSGISAKTIDLYNELQALRKEIDFSGKSDTAYSLLEDIAQTVESLKTDVTSVTELIEDTGVAKLKDSLESARQELEVAAKKEGIEGLVPAKIKEEKLSLESLQDQLTQMRAMLEAIRAIVEKDEVAVQTWFESE